MKNSTEKNAFRLGDLFTPLRQRDEEFVGTAENTDEGVQGIFDKYFLRSVKS